MLSWFLYWYCMVDQLKTAFRIGNGTTNLIASNKRLSFVEILEDFRTVVTLWYFKFSTTTYFHCYPGLDQYRSTLCKLLSIFEIEGLLYSSIQHFFEFVLLIADAWIFRVIFRFWNSNSSIQNNHSSRDQLTNCSSVKTSTFHHFQTVV